MIGSGGFLGLGETTSFMPVDAIRRIVDDEVHLGHTRDEVADAPGYDPGLENDPDYRDKVTRHYGYLPGIPGM